MALNSRSSGTNSRMGDPAVGAIAINYAGGDQVLAVTGRYLYITTTGTLNVIMQDNSAASLTGLIVGTVYPIAVRTIVQAGSTAAGIVLL